MIDKKQLKLEIETAFESFKAAIQMHPDINKKRADGGWTVGQIGNHIIKSTGIVFATTGKTQRPYDQNVESIKALFLDLNAKFPTAPSLSPDDRQFSIEQIIDALDQNRNNIMHMIENADLTETFTDISLPVWGRLTIFEWIVLMEYHIIRHTHQVHQFKPFQN